jgi:hypothetical protein
MTFLLLNINPLCHFFSLKAALIRVPTMWMIMEEFCAVELDARHNYEENMGLAEGEAQLAGGGKRKSLERKRKRQELKNLCLNIEQYELVDYLIRVSNLDLY